VLSLIRSLAAIAVFAGWPAAAWWRAEWITCSSVRWPSGSPLALINSRPTLPVRSAPSPATRARCAKRAGGWSSPA